MSQMIDQKINLTSDKVFEHLNDVLNANSIYYENVRIRSAAIQKDDKWVNAVCYAKAFPMGQVPAKQTSRRYKQLHLLEDWLSVNELPRFFQETTTNTLKIDGEKIELDPKLIYWEWRQNEAKNQFSDLTGFLYIAEVRGGNSINIPYEPLRTPKLPPYPDCSQAIEDWIEVDNLNLNSGGFRGGIFIFLPERRAYFEELSLTKANLRIKIGMDAKLVGKIFLTGTWQNNLKKVAEFSEENLQSEINIVVPENANGCQAHLVDEAGNPLDQRTAHIISTDNPSSMFRRQLHQFEALDSEEILSPGERISEEDFKQGPNPRNVFVVHGRNNKLTDELKLFLRTLDLHPLEWSEAVAMTHEPSPYVGEVLQQVFSQAAALVVLMTPDDEVRLKEAFCAPDDGEMERNLQGQCRPNVIFEAGMALGLYPERTILIEFGNPKPFSDKTGRHVVKLDNSPEKRQELIDKLKIVGCSLKISGTDWLKAGQFSVSGTEAKKTPAIKQMDVNPLISDVKNQSRIAVRTKKVLDKKKNGLERSSAGYYLEASSGRLLCGLCWERDGSKRTLIKRKKDGPALAVIPPDGRGSGFGSWTELLKCPECGTEYAHQHKSQRF